MKSQPAIRVLFVDDEINIRTVFETVLQEAGYWVKTAKDGREGWNLFRGEKSWDVAIVDRAMPEIGGEELAKMIKGTSPRTTLIMITGAPEAITEPGFFDAILAKPFDPSELLNCLSKALRGNYDRPLWDRLWRCLSHRKRAMGGVD